MTYQHGGDIYTNCVTLDYSANLNPLGLPPAVKTALLQSIDRYAPYPDSCCTPLKEKLSCFHQIPRTAIIVGNGAADLIFQVVQAKKPQNALLITPSFSEYEQALNTISCHLTFCRLKEEENFRLSVTNLKDCIEKAKIPIQMVFLCNPNNPTGFVTEGEEIKDFLDFCKDREIFCVIDECFNEFLEENTKYSILPFLRTGGYENVFLLKAFTKIYAMAGLRLGYGICTSIQTLSAMEQVRQPWTVSTPAQVAGEAALSEEEYVARTKILIAKEREFLKAGLSALGFFVYDSRANYIFFKDLREEAGKMEKLLYFQLLLKQVLIRSCANYRGLDDSYYRICVKERKDNEAFLSILQSVIKEGKEQKTWQKQL